MKPLFKRFFPHPHPFLRLGSSLLLGLGVLAGGDGFPALHATQARPLVLMLLLPAVLLALWPLGFRRRDGWLVPALALPLFAHPGLAAFTLLPLGGYLLLRDASLRFQGAMILLAAVGSLVHGTPQFFWLSDLLSRGASGLLGDLTGKPLEWGDSTGPTVLLVFFLLRGLAGRVLRVPRMAWASLAALAVWLFAHLYWVGGWSVAPVYIPVWPVMAIAALMLVAETLVRGEAADVPPLPGTRKAWLVSALAALGLLVVIHSALPFTRRDLTGVKVAFRDEGDWSWESTREGTRPGPRMGGLLDVLRRWGATVDILDDTRLQSAAGDYDLVFVIHPTEPMPNSLRTALLDYTEQGGALVVVGEHTDVGGIRAGVNDLLRDTGMRLKDDSAIPAWRGWNWNYVQRALLSPVTRGLDNAHRFGISIGGSLDVKWPAQPLVLGTLAFSDRGDPDNPRGKMGDNRYTWDERFGSIVVAATQARGKGVICAIGDTSGLMSLSTPQVWPFYLDLARGLLARPLFGRSLLWPIAGLLLLLATLPLLLRGGAGRPLLAWSTLAVLAVLPASAWQRGHESPVAVRREGICWIDYSHQNPYHFASSMDWSVSSLLEACYNAGRTPLFLWDVDTRQLEGCQWLLVNGSARRWSRGEARDIRAWVETGGRLVIAGDYRRRAALRPLLHELQLDIGDTPLGTAPESRNRMGLPAEFQFYEAWPVECTAGDLDTLVSCWGFPVVGMRPVGKGVVSIIGDERLLTKWGMEGPQRNGRPLNTARRFLESMQPQPLPPQASPAQQAWRTQYLDSLNVVPTPGPEMPLDRLARRQQLVYGMLGLPQPVQRPMYPGGSMPGGMMPGGRFPGGTMPGGMGGPAGSGAFRGQPGTLPAPGAMPGTPAGALRQGPAMGQGPVVQPATPPRRITPLRQPDRRDTPAGGTGK